MAAEKNIADFAVGDHVEGFYIMKTAQSKLASNGRPFLAASLMDVTGLIEAKVWDYAGPIGAGDEGKVVKIRGEISEYRGSKQCGVSVIRLAAENDSYDASRLVPTAPIDADACMAELGRLTGSIADADYRRIAEEMLRRHAEELRRIPAGKSVHHDGIGGLLMHTANMLRLADFLSKQYADTVDRSLLLAGTLLHDFAKAREFRFSSLGLVTEYTVEGELLGHLVMGAQEVAEVAKSLGVAEEKSVLLQHMLLSHHGDPQFGAAVRPAIAESELLSLIDMLDSRMEIYRKAHLETPAGEFSQKIFALDKKIYHHE